MNINSISIKKITMVPIIFSDNETMKKKMASITYSSIITNNNFLKILYYQIYYQTNNNANNNNNNNNNNNKLLNINPNSLKNFYSTLIIINPYLNLIILQKQL